jgi:hypothetical protein
VSLAFASLHSEWKHRRSVPYLSATRRSRQHEDQGTVIAISAPGTYSSTVTVTVTAGVTTPLNITLQGTQPRFDPFENGLLIRPVSPVLWVGPSSLPWQKRDS